MSKKLSKILSVVLAVLMLVSVIPMTASAAVFSGECGADGDNLTWKIDESTATLYINGTGDMKNYSSTYGTEAPPWNQYYDRFIYVSIGDEVSSIGDYAFVRCSYVDEIEIGKGINDIGYNTFDSETQTITVNAENPYMYIDENQYLLSQDDTILYYILSGNQFAIPEGIIDIRASAFVNCLFDENDQLYIPASVQKIDLDKCFIYKDYETNQPAFSVDENNQYFSSDEYGALYNKDKTIMYRGAAAAKKSYPYYEIPETVIEIADYAFFNYSGDNSEQTYIVFPQNLKRIGKEALWVSASLKLFIPLSVEQLDAYFCFLYDGAAGSTTIYYEGTQEQLESIYSLGDMYYEPSAIKYEHTNHIFKDKDLGNCTTASSCITCGFIAEANTEHNWEYYSQQAASCVDGYIKYRCDNCGDYKSETIPATGEHVWYTEDYFWCERTVDYYCEYCDAHKSEKVEHQWFLEGGTADINCAGGERHYRCELCEKFKTEIIPPVMEHSWEIVDKDEDNVSCESGGTIYYYCPVCYSEKTEILPATSEHNWEITNQTDATCANDGVVNYSCTRCGNTKSETILATGEHSWTYSADKSTSATCGKAGQDYYFCENCSATKTERIPATENHSWYTGEKADCVNDKEATYYCHNCTTATKTETIPAIGEHTWTVDSQKDATCANEGAIYYSCSNCADTKTETIPATGNHDMYWKFNNDATCIQDGTKTSYCKTCDTDGFETVTAQGTAFGHTFNDWVTLSEVSCSQDGIRVCACKTCSDIKVDTQKAYGHFDDDNDGRCDDCACLLEYTDTPDTDAPDEPETPDESETPDTSDDSAVSALGSIFATLIDLLNQITEFFKNLFGIK